MFLSFFNLLRKSPFILVLFWCCKQLTKRLLLLFEKYKCICITPRNIFPRKIQGRASGILSFIYSPPIPLTLASVHLENVFSGVPAPATPTQSSGRAAGGWAVRTGPPSPAPACALHGTKPAEGLPGCVPLPGPAAPVSAALCCSSLSETVKWSKQRQTNVLWQLSGH